VRAVFLEVLKKEGEHGKIRLNGGSWGVPFSKKKEGTTRLALRSEASQAVDEKVRSKNLQALPTRE